MQTIPVSRGCVALVDDEDHAHLSTFNWFAKRNGNRSWYACRHSSRSEGTRYDIAMHREIMGLLRTDRRTVDHINLDSLDNRRTNLRIATHAENCRNQALKKSNTSGFKGVSFHKATGKWSAKIRFDGKSIHLGLFSSPTSAAQIYQEKARELHGAFARF